MKIFKVGYPDEAYDKINQASAPRGIELRASIFNQSGVTTRPYTRVTVILIEY
jgi:hypothetical protein